MTKLSEERISHLAHLIIDKLWKDDVVDFNDEGLALRVIKEAFAEIVKAYEDADKNVRAKISPDIPEGSREWTMQYKRLYDQELTKIWKR